MPNNFQEKANFIWQVADDILRGTFKAHEYGDVILPFVGRRQILGVDVFQPEEYARATGANRFLDEAGNLVAHHVDLHRELNAQPLLLAQTDKAIENGFPVPVSRKVVIGDEKTASALGNVGPHESLHVVGAAAPRLVALDVDDRAETAIERASAAGIERRVEHAPPCKLARQERRDLTL